MKGRQPSRDCTTTGGSVSPRSHRGTPRRRTLGSRCGSTAHPRGPRARKVLREAASDPGARTTPDGGRRAGMPHADGRERQTQPAFHLLELFFAETVTIGQGRAPPCREGPDEVPCLRPVRYAVVHGHSCIGVAHHPVDRTRSADPPGNDQTADGKRGGPRAAPSLVPAGGALAPGRSGPAGSLPSPRASAAASRRSASPRPPHPPCGLGAAQASRAAVNSSGRNPYSLQDLQTAS